MNIDDYIRHIKDVLVRMDEMFADVHVNSDDKKTLESIGNQLKFILSYAESGKSFKQGLLERKRQVVKSRFEDFPSTDRALREAIRTVYNDLDAHDYNVGIISREMSEYYFEFIANRSLYHDDLVKKNSLEDEHYVSYRLADIVSHNLFRANYTEGWIDHGIKKLQYFFLVNLFSYLGQVWPTIDQFPHPDAIKLSDDIVRIAQFYKTDEAEGTHMYLNPVEIKEIDGQTYLVDMKGDIVV